MSASLSAHERAVLDRLDTDALVDSLVDLVRIPSVGGSDAEIEVQQHVAAELTDLDADVDCWDIDLDEVTADPHYPQHGNPSLDVLAYQLDLGWDPDDEVLTGTATLTLRALADVGEIRLDFSEAYQVDEVTVDGTPAAYSRPTDDIAVERGLAAQARATLVVRYRGTPQPVPMPSMMLQTLVENAIKHGLEPKTGGGTIWILARKHDDHATLTVADDGQGFGGQSTGTGIGLKNLRERLRLTFGNEASFAIVSNFPSGVAATLTLPLDGKAGAA